MTLSSDFPIYLVRYLGRLTSGFFLSGVSVLNASLQHMSRIKYSDTFVHSSSRHWRLKEALSCRAETGEELKMERLVASGQAR